MIAATSRKPLILRLLSEAINLANWAGDEIRHITRTCTKPSQLGVVDKGDKDFQTKADRLVQRLITVNLTKLFPECIIVGEEDLVEDKEEDLRLLNKFKDSLSNTDAAILKMTLPDDCGYENLTEKDITVWVDPLDGTAELVEGNIQRITVLIGISVKGSAIAGVIHQPFLKSTTDLDEKGRTMWGLVGLGCFGIAPKETPNPTLLGIITTKSHGNQNIEDTIEAIKPDRVLRIGGAGYKVLCVIEGEAHSYVFPSNGCKRWDTAAPEAILKASGGKLTDIFGNPYDYNYRTDNDYQNYLGVIASSKESMHSRIIKSIPNHVANGLLELQKQNLKPKC